MEKVLEQDLYSLALRKAKRRIVAYVFRADLNETLRLAKEAKVPVSNLLKYTAKHGAEGGNNAE